MKSTLEIHKEWESPKLAVENVPPDLSIVLESMQPLTNCSDSLLIDVHLGPLKDVTQSTAEIASPQVAEAYTNYLVDIDIKDVTTETTSTRPTPTVVMQHLKGLQPN